MQKGDTNPDPKDTNGDAVRVRAGNAPRNTATKEDPEEHDFKVMEKRFIASSAVSIGDNFNCAYCGKEKVKMNIEHKNCSPKCGNAYNKLATRRNGKSEGQRAEKSSSEYAEQGIEIKLGTSSPLKKKGSI